MKKILSTIAIIAAVTFTSQAQNAHLLSPKAGSVYTSATSVEMGMKIMGKKMGTDMKMYSTISVLESNADSVVLKQVTDSLVAVLNMNGESKMSNSNQPETYENFPNFEMLKDKIGKEQTFVYNTKGELIRTPKEESSMGEGGNDSYYLNGKQLKVGDKITKKKTAEVQGKTLVNITTATVKKVDAKEILYDVNVKNDMIEMNGTTTADAQTGMLLQQESKGKMSQMGMKMDMTSVTSYKQVK